MGNNLYHMIAQFIVFFAPGIKEQEGLSLEETKVRTIRQIVEGFEVSESEATMVYERVEQGEPRGVLLEAYRELSTSTGSLDYLIEQEPIFLPLKEILSYVVTCTDFETESKTVSVK